MSAYLGIPRCDSVNIENALDIAGDVAQRFRAAGFIYQHRLVIKFPDGRAAASAGGLWKDHKHYYPVIQTMLYLKTP